MIRVDGDHWIKTVSTKQLSVTSNIFSPGGMGGGGMEGERYTPVLSYVTVYDFKEYYSVFTHFELK